MKIFSSRVEKIKKELEKLGARKLRHVKGYTLYDHLVRVQEILLSWGCDENIQVAGMCHSIYSTQYFTQAITHTGLENILTEEMGPSVKKVVTIFSHLDRNSLVYISESDTFLYNNFYTKESKFCSHEEGVTLIHVMLANDIDHIDLVGVGKLIHNFRKYKDILLFLNKKAQEELCKIVSFEEVEKSDVEVRFLGHSGVVLRNKETCITIDPWLYDSLRENPIIEGFDPTQRVIDYLIPESKNAPEDISPDVVCFSHFHTHHSPLREILEFAKIKPITIVCPTLSEKKLTAIEEKIGTYLFGRLTFKFLTCDETFTVKGFTIKAFMHHDDMPHFMYHITLDEISILHLVDAVTHKLDGNRKDFDESWERVRGIEPTYFFIGCVGHSVKSIKKGVRSIIESATLTPVQAANLVVITNAKTVIPIGMYNHSVWDDRFEIGLSVGDAEAMFHWAVSFLSPKIKFRKVYPGDVLS